MVSDAKAVLVPPKLSSTRADRDQEVAKLSIDIWWKNVQIDINSYLTAREQAEPARIDACVQRLVGKSRQGISYSVATDAMTHRLSMITGSSAGR